MIDSQELQNQIVQGLESLGISASSQQVQQLLDYLLLLIKWNKAYNLTAVRDPKQMVSRHLLDSLALLPYVHGRELIDVGSGAGLPGIPLAIFLPEAQVTSLDSNGKKTRFQFQVKVALGLDNFQVHQSRVEDFQPVEKSKQLVSRAFASLKDFVELTECLAAEDACWLAMKGQYPEQELEELPKQFQLHSSYSIEVPAQEGLRHLLILQRKTEKG